MKACEMSLIIGVLKSAESGRLVMKHFREKTDGTKDSGDCASGISTLIKNIDYDHDIFGMFGSLGEGSQNEIMELFLDGSVGGILVILQSECN
jgi:hypothetical protein